MNDDTVLASPAIPSIDLTPFDPKKCHRARRRHVWLQVRAQDGDRCQCGEALRPTAPPMMREAGR